MVSQNMEGCHCWLLYKLIKKNYFFSGHEFSGRVVAFGAGAEELHSNVKIGDLVVAEQVLTCGKCRFCLKVA